MGKEVVLESSGVVHHHHHHHKHRAAGHHSLNNNKKKHCPSRVKQPHSVSKSTSRTTMRHDAILFSNLKPREFAQEVVGKTNKVRPSYSTEGRSAAGARFVG